MRKYGRLLLVISILLVGTLFTTGCNAVLVAVDKKVEPGELETRQYVFDEFTDVDISSAFSYEIQEADNWSIEITAGRNLFENISVTQSGKVLEIDIKMPHGTIWITGSYPRPQAIITMPELHSLVSSGATEGTVTGFRSDGNLEISLSGACKVELSDLTAGRAFMEASGASRITGDIRVDSIEINIDSAGKVNLEGSTDNLLVDASGASQAELMAFITQDADITLSGASKCVVSPNVRMDVKVSGASTLEYTGEPEIGVLDVSGASTFRKK